MQPTGRIPARGDIRPAGAAPGGDRRSAGHRPGGQGRAETRLATAGLAVVLVSLAGFGLWVAFSTSRATREVTFVTGLRDAFETARFALAAEESLERGYRLDRDPQALSELDRTARRLADALAFADRYGDKHDRSPIALIRSQHEHYRQLSRDMLAAVQAGHSAQAAALARQGRPLFQAMVREIDEVAQHERAEAVTALTEGDLLLMQVGDRLASMLRDIDTVARLGGDEFAILLPRIATAEAGVDAGVDAAVEVAKRLTAGFHEPFIIEGLTIDVEASSGVALYPEHAGNADDLLQRADIAMYVAKDSHAGFVVFDATQDQHSPRRLALLGELRRALDHEQLVLHYQPKVDTRTGQLLGVEALVRWQHPEHGLLPPAEFIPLIERTGLMQPMTHYVLNAALRQSHEWQRAGHEVSVAVNVSPRRVLDLTFPDEVADLRATWDVPATRLVIEITESTIMADPVHALQVLSRLNATGVQLAIDDFGTGYSSMAYLRNLPVHELKVDRTFVTHMTSNASDATIVRSTLNLGHNLGLRVVAEGVEDRATLLELDALGCDAIQGYYISKPMPADDLSRWRDQMPARVSATMPAPVSATTTR